MNGLNEEGCECITHADLSDVINQATGSPRPVSGCLRRTVKVESFLTPSSGRILVALCVESMQRRSVPCSLSWCFCHGEKKPTTTFGSGLVVTCENTCHCMA